VPGLSLWGWRVTTGKLFKTNWIGEVFGILICHHNLQPGEYRICSIMPVDPISLTGSLHALLRTSKPLVVERSSHT
jgi:hypothetical protein